MDDMDKRLYELAFLLESESDVQEVQRLCSQHNFEIKNDGQLKKINLAYKVGKLTQAYFGFLRLLGLPEDIKLLEKDLKTARQVKRFLIVRLPKGAFVQREQVASLARRPAPKRSISPMPLQKPAAEALSNEELERKIEEILQ